LITLFFSQPGWVKTFPKIFNLIECLKESTNAENGTVYFYNKARGELCSNVAIQDNIRITVAKHSDIFDFVLKSGKTLFSKNASMDPLFQDMNTEKMKALVVTPLKISDENVGILEMHNLMSTTAFDDDCTMQTTAVAKMISSLIINMQNQPYFGRNLPIPIVKVADNKPMTTVTTTTVQSKPSKKSDKSSKDSGATTVKRRNGIPVFHFHSVNPDKKFKKN